LDKKSDPTLDGRIDAVFHALSSTARRSILAQLKNGPMRITDIAAEHNLSLNAVSKHIKVLERGGLIERNIEGRVHRCAVITDDLADADNWLSLYHDYWSERLDNFGRFLAEKN